MKLKVYSDTDWAGCPATRRSRSGGMILMMRGLVKSWSNRQRTAAMSSGEAEYYAVVKASAEALGVQAFAADLGWKMSVELNVDSSAAKAIASRLGPGKVRHLEGRYLRLQEVVASGRIVMKNTWGKEKRRRAHQVLSPRSRAAPT